MRLGPLCAAALAFASPVSAQTLTGPSVHALGFADLSYRIAEGDRTEGFLLGQAVAHVTALLSDRFSVTSEVSATGRSAGFDIEIERLFARYTFSDLFKVSVGRYHTPISYWNTAYHHGLWLQTTVQRPEMIRFGSRLMPVHFVGLQIEGNAAPATLGFGYDVGFGNGRSANIARAGDNGDVNDHRAFSAALRLRPPSAAGLQVGASLYLDRVPQTGDAPDLRERIASAHIAWTGRAPELIGEYARFWHAPDDGRSDFVSSGAYYLQLAFRLAGRAEGFKPYARFETIDPDRDDAFLQSLELDYEAIIVGVRWDFVPLGALKGEFRSERFGAGDRLGSFVAQLSFALSGPGASGS